MYDMMTLLGSDWNGLYNEHETNWSGIFTFFSNISVPINEGITEGAAGIDASPIITAIIAGITGGSDQIRAAIASSLNLGDIPLNGALTGESTESDATNLVENIEQETKGSLEQVSGWLSGMGIELPEIDTSAVTEPLNDLLNTGKETVEGQKDSFFTIFTDLFSTFGLGANANVGAATTAGANLANGAAAGASANAGRFFSLGAAAGRNYLAGFRWAARIGSPSKAMMEMMGYIADGFELGHTKYQDVFTGSGDADAQAYLDSMRETLAPLSLLMAEEIDPTPVIRPVIDLSDVEQGAKTLRGTFGGGYNLGFGRGMPSLVGRTSVPANANTNPNQNGANASRMIESIGARMDRMQAAIENLEVVLDSGELVGGIANKMDKKLGVKAAQARRR